jgi:hypothetical protein
MHVKNDEKLSSSVFRSIVRAVKVDPQLREVLGEVIRPQPEWWLNGDPYVSGQVSTSIFLENSNTFESLIIRVILDRSTTREH